MDRADQAISSNEECRGPSIQVFGLSNLVIPLAWFPSDQLGIFGAIVLNESADLREALELFCWFEVEGDNLKAQTAVILPVEFFEKGASSC